MPKLDGIRDTRQIHKQFPETQVLILSATTRTAMCSASWRQAQPPDVLKEAADDEVLAAIRAAARGEPFSRPACVAAPTRWSSR